MWWWPCLVLAAGAFAQTATYQSSTRDVNGYSVPGVTVTETRSGGDYTRTERTQSINGHMVPLERIEERVIREDASGRVVERTIQRYDQNGSPAPPDRVVIEQRGSTLRTTTYRGDINGNSREVERSVTEKRKAGATETSETTTERPTLNGSMQVVEKVSVVKTGTPGAFEQSTTTQRLGVDGFYEALRISTTHRQSESGTRDETAEYEVGSSGRIELHSQTVVTVTKRADGSEVESTDVFGQSVPGTTGTEGAQLKLKERDTIERRASPDGAVREKLLVQRPTLADPGVLDSGRVVSETVCRGKCSQ